MEVFISDFNHLAFKAVDSFQIMTAPTFTLLLGPCGSGKTFFLNYVYQKSIKSGLNTIFINSETFAKEYAYAAYENKFTSFRQRYRAVDLLIIDDFHRLNGKVKTIEELLYTCESISAKEGKLIIAFSGNINQLDFLNNRFRSRLLSGGQITINHPKVKEVIRFLQYYLEKKSITIEDEIIVGVAHNFPILTDAIVQIDRFLVYCVSKNLKLNLSNFIYYLEEENKQRLVKKDPETIIDLISTMSGIAVEDILSKKRSGDIVKARQLAIYLIKKSCNLSYPQIGKLFGRNHSVIINTCQQIESKIKYDEDLKAKIDAVNNNFINN